MSVLSGNKSENVSITLPSIDSDIEFKLQPQEDFFFSRVERLLSVNLLDFDTLDNVTSKSSLLSLIDSISLLSSFEISLYTVLSSVSSLYKLLSSDSNSVNDLDIMLLPDHVKFFNPEIDE